jgi:hypothetical protein
LRANEEEAASALVLLWVFIPSFFEVDMMLILLGISTIDPVLGLLLRGPP